MPQPNLSIQDSISVQQTGRLWYNRNQYITYRLFGTTTDATQTELFVDGVSGARIALPFDSMSVFSVRIASLSPTEGSGSTIHGGISNIANTVALVGTNVADVHNDGTPQTTYSVNADNTNKALRVQVTGTAATVIAHEAIVTLAVSTSPESNFGSLT